MNNLKNKKSIAQILIITLTIILVIILITFLINKNSINTCNSGYIKIDELCTKPYTTQGFNYALSDNKSEFTNLYIQTTHTIKDTVLGLEWERSPSTSKINFLNSKSHCDNLVKAGYSDWQLPTEVELHNSLVDSSQISEPYIVGKQNNLFKNIKTDTYYWTTTKVNITQHLISFKDGSSSYRALDEEYYIICVRPSKLFIIDIKPSQQNTDNGGRGQERANTFEVGSQNNCGDNNSIQDKLYNLCWERSPSNITRKWATSSSYKTPVWNKDTNTYNYPNGRNKNDYPAHKYCEELTTSSKTNWRLPNPNELLTLLKDEDTSYSKTISYLIKIGFTISEDPYYWSGSKSLVSGSDARIIYLGNGGFSYYYGLSSTFYVICVRNS